MIFFLPEINTSIIGSGYSFACFLQSPKKCIYLSVQKSSRLKKGRESWETQSNFLISLLPNTLTQLQREILSNSLMPSGGNFQPRNLDLDLQNSTNFVCCVGLGCQRGAHRGALSLYLLAGQRKKKIQCKSS